MKASASYAVTAKRNRKAQCFLGELRGYAVTRPSHVCARAHLRAPARPHACVRVRCVTA